MTWFGIIGLFFSPSTERRQLPLHRIHLEEQNWKTCHCRAKGLCIRAEQSRRWTRVGTKPGAFFFWLTTKKHSDVSCVAAATPHSKPWFHHPNPQFKSAWRLVLRHYLDSSTLVVDLLHTVCFQYSYLNIYKLYLMCVVRLSPALHLILHFQSYFGYLLFCCIENCL